MNTFQVVVIGALILVFGGSIYYFIKADSQGILSQSISGNRLEQNQQRMVEVSGNYYCSTLSGCKNLYDLSLNENGAFELTISYNEGAEILAEKGDWSIVERGYIKLNIIGNQSTNYDIPKTIIIKSVKTSTLSNLVYSDKQYSDMKNPVFSKIQE
ncbi:TPA: hypothetical protein DEP94_01365 [Candidatus Nomurabacteria bacterium]|nr:hypothetical protein [Candidatus Nomurabacteria bacterium]